MGSKFTVQQNDVLHLHLVVVYVSCTMYNVQWLCMCHVQCTM